MKEFLFSLCSLPFSLSNKQDPTIRFDFVISEEMLSLDLKYSNHCLPQKDWSPKLFTEQVWSSILHEEKHFIQSNIKTKTIMLYMLMT